MFFHCRGLSSEEGCRRLGLNPVSLNFCPTSHVEGDSRPRPETLHGASEPQQREYQLSCVRGERQAHRCPAKVGPRSCLNADMDAALVTLWPARRDLGMYN